MISRLSARASRRVCRNAEGRGVSRRSCSASRAGLTPAHRATRSTGTRTSGREQRLLPLAALLCPAGRTQTGRDARGPVA